MAEQVDLTTAETFTSTTSYKVVLLTFDRLTPMIHIRVQANVSGRFKDFRYESSTALALMNQINKANLTSNSMEKRVLQRLIDDGLLIGTISGTPD